MQTESALMLPHELVNRLQRKVLETHSSCPAELIAAALDSLELGAAAMNAPELESSQLQECGTIIDEYHRDPSTGISLEELDRSLEAEFARLRAEEAEQPHAA